jgi:porin
MFNAPSPEATRLAPQQIARSSLWRLVRYLSPTLPVIIAVSGDPAWAELTKADALAQPIVEVSSLTEYEQTPVSTNASDLVVEVLPLPKELSPPIDLASESSETEPAETISPETPAPEAVEASPAQTPAPATPVTPEASGSQTAPSDQSLGQRSQLTGDWGGARSFLQKKGVTFDLEWTQFYQGLGAGTGPKSFDYGGRLDAFLHFDTGKLGLWKGGGLHTHLEYRYGTLPAFRGGTLLPVNTGALLPLGSADTVVASSLYLSQQFGNRATLMIGKINTVDLLAADLFFGGGGIHRFMNVAFVAPPTGVTPPVIFGAIVNVKVKPVTLTFMVFDPDDRTTDYWPDDLFQNGVNFTLAATYATAIASRPTSFSLSGTYSTKAGTDLSSILLAPGVTTNNQRRGAYSIGFGFSHLLHVNPNNPREGWGVFLKAAIDDGNPNPFQGSL